MSPIQQKNPLVSIRTALPASLFNKVLLPVSLSLPRAANTLVSSLLLLGCADPLGMENYKITAAQISASSQFDKNHVPSQGRLHIKGGGGYSGCWSAGASNLGQWIQIDLRVETNVEFVATQGRHGNLNQQVTQYRLQYSKDGLSFLVYKKAGENSDAVSNVKAT